MGYDPNEPRNEKGEWTSGGSGDAIKKAASDKKKPLSKTQQEVVDKLKDGWVLQGGNYSGFELRRWNESKKVFESQKVSNLTLFHLKEKGIIVQEGNAYATTTKYKLV